MATIKDVARLAGVGVGTASRVINGKGSFSPDALARVEAAARELQFTPSSIARALSLRESGMIGIYVPDFHSPFYGPLLNAVDNELRIHRRHMVAANGIGSDRARQKAVDGVAFLIDRECDGIIVVSNELRDADLMALKARQPRIAVLNREVKGMKDASFSVDHVHAGRIAAQHLIAHGHRSLAVLGGPQSALDNRQRLRGFFACCAEAGIAEAALPREDGEFSAEFGWAAVGRLLQRKRRPTAVFCANDLIAMGALARLAHAGVSVPGEVSVIGYDDTQLAAYLAPRLTSVHIPIAEMGTNACRLLLNQCDAMALPVARAFEPRLAERDSVAAARR